MRGNRGGMAYESMRHRLAKTTGGGDGGRLARIKKLKGASAAAKTKKAAKWRLCPHLAQ